jgi:hypothetical protein
MQLQHIMSAGEVPTQHWLEVYLHRASTHHGRNFLLEFAAFSRPDLLLKLNDWVPLCLGLNAGFTLKIPQQRCFVVIFAA